MKKTKKKKGKRGRSVRVVSADPLDQMWEESWTYIKTVVDIMHEPFLILDKNLCVMAANESFYRTFQVEARDTEKKLVYELGNGQWNIPALRKLLEEILPRNSFFKGFEVSHDFPLVGHKVMILNARRIYREGAQSKLFPPIILLAMEDVSEMMLVAKRLSDHINDFEAGVTGKATRLELNMGRLERDIVELKKKA
ncbi:MAG: hypothetical protein PHS53_04300 [Candidatus Pacebacteria bacterium]|nr:hypothetical protein [Candidatus Paceibacterota bacterium]MDD5357340.1 hypothetical protein [Candidatus Paceibacterota bacterium]